MAIHRSYGIVNFSTYLVLQKIIVVPNYVEMDKFTQNTLKEWGFEDMISTFKGN